MWWLEKSSQWCRGGSDGGNNGVLVLVLKLSESSSTSDHPEILVRAAARMNDVNTLVSTERIH